MKRVLVLLFGVMCLVGCERNNDQLAGATFIAYEDFNDYRLVKSLIFSNHKTMVFDTHKEWFVQKPSGGIDNLPTTWSYSLKGNTLTLSCLDYEYTDDALYMNDTIYWHYCAFGRSTN